MPALPAVWNKGCCRCAEYNFAERFLIYGHLLCKSGKTVYDKSKAVPGSQVTRNDCSYLSGDINMKNKPELLAPAGNSEALHAAVENGADAVYLGGKLFSARQLADNFELDMLKNEIEYAHVRGVNIYLTMNTLVEDDELEQALDFAADMRRAGIDGIIVQDIGLAGALHRVMPDVPLHASTQMTIYDSDGVRMLEEMGFKRAVLARELSLREAAEITRNTSLEIEVFVHGALCVCYSGQCLMSSIIGGRSGNHGRCAQPCRLPYRLISSRSSDRSPERNAQYLLSPKDMCSLEFVDELVSSGIRSLKIEGRMKSPEYVATVVRIYRKYLDLAMEHTKIWNIAKEDMHDLLQIFNRGGFSAGYMKGKAGSSMMCFDKPNNSGIYLGSVLYYDEWSQNIIVRLEDNLSTGDGIEIWTGGSDSPGGVVTSIKKAENVKSRPQFFRILKEKLRTATSGNIAAIGNFKGKILPGQKVFKTSDIELNRRARESFTGKNARRVGVSGYAELKAGQPLMLRVEDPEGHTVSVSGTIPPEKAMNRPITMERLREQLNKTGSTPFDFKQLQIALEDGLALPVSEINDVRRQALENLVNARANRYTDLRVEDGIHERMEQVLQQLQPAAAIKKPEYRLRKAAACSASFHAGRQAGNKTEPAISLYFYKWDPSMDYAGLGADRIYLPFAAAGTESFQNTAASLGKAGIEVFAWLPPVTRGNLNRLMEKFIYGKDTAAGHALYEEDSGSANASQYLDGILAGNLGTVRRLKEMCKDGNVKGMRLAGDISLNLYNSLSLQEAAKMGMDSAALSVEMTLQQIRGLKAAIQSDGRQKDSSDAAMNVPSTYLSIEAAVYGRLPLMISEHCPVGCVEGGFSASSACSGSCSREAYRLKDRRGVEFPVICDKLDCRSIILNSNVLFAPESAESLKTAGVGILRLYILDEPAEVIRELIKLYRAAAEDSGRVQKDCGGLMEKIKAAGFTRGYLK